MKKVLKWFSLLFAVSVTVFVIFFLYNINKAETIEKSEPLEYKTLLKEQQPEALWLNHLSNTKKRGYYFPVDEVYIKTNLVKKENGSKKIYQLVVNDLDPYQIFCLEQELKRHKIKFFFKKERNVTNLFVFSDDMARLNSLVKVLKNYQIDATIKR